MPPICLLRAFPAISPCWSPPTTVVRGHPLGKEGDPGVRGTGPKDTGIGRLLARVEAPRKSVSWLLAVRASAQNGVVRQHAGRTGSSCALGSRFAIESLGAGAWKVDPPTRVAGIMLKQDRFRRATCSGRRHRGPLDESGIQPKDQLARAVGAPDRIVPLGLGELDGATLVQVVRERRTTVFAPVVAPAEHLFAGPGDLGGRRTRCHGPTVRMPPRHSAASRDKPVPTRIGCVLAAHTPTTRSVRRRLTKAKLFQDLPKLEHSVGRRRQPHSELLEPTRGVQIDGLGL